MRGYICRNPNCPGVSTYAADCCGMPMVAVARDRSIFRLAAALTVLALLSLTLTTRPGPARPPMRDDDPEGPSRENCILCANVGAGCPYHGGRSR
jgi:hypothetical protein